MCCSGSSGAGSLVFDTVDGLDSSGLKNNFGIKTALRAIDPLFNFELTGPAGAVEIAPFEGVADNFLADWPAASVGNLNGQVILLNQPSAATHGVAGLTVGTGDQQATR